MAMNLTWIGLALTAGTLVSYAVMLAVRRFTYRSWMFHIPVAVGLVLSMIGWATGAPTGPAIATLVVTGLWVYLMTYEIGVRGSDALRLRVGGTVPPFKVVTVAGTTFTELDLIANAPALLQLYRGWWCPSSDIQLQEMLDVHEQLDELGVATYAASVDSPQEAEPLQKKLGAAITLLCNVQDTTLDALGVEDRRGAAWYSRLRPGVKQRPIAMPSAIAIGKDGTIVYCSRTSRVDERAEPAEILAALRAHSEPR